MANTSTPWWEDYARYVNLEDGTWQLNDDGIIAEVPRQRPVSETGGEKEASNTSYSSMPWDALRALAEHYHAGQAKYPNDPVTNQPNYRKGYPMSLSFEALHRHLSAYWMGETLDPETQTNHMLAVAWHALNMFTLTGSDWDDRWQGD